MIENMNDAPWCLPSQQGPETTAAMTAVAAAIRSECGPSMPLGIQVLAACNKEALAVAMATGLNFIRAEGFVYSHVADEGMLNSCAGELLRYRRQIGAEHVQIFTDIKKKHCSHAITADVSIEETAKSAVLFGSDGLIVTGAATGETASLEELRQVQRSVSCPVMVGSGITEDNIRQYISANALIIGSHLKMHGLWHNDLDSVRVAHLMKKVNRLRHQVDAVKSSVDDEDKKPLFPQGE